jgi:PKD repeat protein
MRKKNFTVIIFLGIVSTFVSIFSIECVALPLPPDAPTDFTATVMSITRINLTWTKADNADTTYIEQNLFSPWNRSEGTLIYNSTASGYSDTGLSENVHYYYQAWSWNEKDGKFSTTFDTADATTANQPPFFGTTSPVNGSTGQPLSLTWSIPMSDPEGDSLSWTIQCSNGQTDSGSSVTNETRSLVISGLAYSTTYTVWVNATDLTGSGLSTRRWYTFTTLRQNLPPIFGTPTTVNGSTEQPLSLTWSIPINDPEGNLFSWTIQCNNGQASSGTSASNGTKSLVLSDLAYSTTYKVWVNATDLTGSGLYTRRWYTFTTQQQNLLPVFGTPTPVNGSTGHPLSLTWSIPINDPNGDAFSWTIQCSNRQTNSSTGAANGTKLLSLSGLAYSTTYTVWVNATDPTGSGQYTRRWYTFTTIGSDQLVFGTPSPANGSTGNLLSLSWSIPINNPEGNLFSWTIQCSNGQVSSGTNATNGTKSLALSGLSYSKTYKVWVNATDPASSGNYTRKWYTFTTKSSGGPVEPPVEPQNKKPIANASAGEPYQGLVNSTILFDGSRSYDPDGNIIKWLWIFGDNTNGTGKTVTHTYSKAGTYTVTLTVTDNNRTTNTDTTTCMISEIENKPPTKPIITGTKNGPKNTRYTYTAVSTDADNDTIQYTFDWGDPLSISQSSGFLISGISYTVNHVWTTAGRYDVTVTATDNQTNNSSKITVYIDAIQTGDIGYLIDNNGDGVYDAFYSDVSKQITTVQKKDGNYNIDSDGNGEWDYTFDSANRLISYQQPNTPGFEIILVMCAIAFVFLWRRKRRS